MSPHSGTNYSNSFMSQTKLGLRELRFSEDIIVEYITFFYIYLNKLHINSR